MGTHRLAFGRAAVLALAGLAAGCGGTPLEGIDDADTTEDAAEVAVADTGGLPPRPDAGPAADTGAATDAGPAVDTGAATDAGPAVDTGGALDAGPAEDTGSVGFCARVRCASGTECCEALMRCIDPRRERCSDVPPPVDAGVDAGAGDRCASSRECGAGRECVYPETVCTREGACTAQIMCLRPEAFCSCAGETYLACRPDRPTRARGRCDGGPVDAGPVDAGSFCAVALCGPGTRCCEAARRCLPLTEPCPGTTPDAGIDAGPGRCLANADCAAGTYCAGDGCGTLGVCAARPSGCTREYVPVCGCDGRTYGNACTAAAAGVRVASRGECGAAVDAGVGFCATVRCRDGAFCCEALRACVPTGTSCPGAPDAGVIDAGVPGGCVRSADCGAGRECVYADSLCARSGTCTAQIMCLRPEAFCSCTGETYLACRPDRPTRARGACGGVVDAGVADAGAGACRTDRDCASGQACCGLTGRCYDPRCLSCCMFAPVDAGTAACRSNADCGRTEWCAGDACGTAGRCEARPGACIEVYAPVCGCDNRTYPNSCYAASAGVRVQYRGTCRAGL